MSTISTHQSSGPPGGRGGRIEGGRGGRGGEGSRGGRGGEGRGRGGGDAKVHLSKKLSYLLRHGAIKEGLPITSEGFVSMEDMVKHVRY
jgi:2'-phosphotransferase